MIATATIYISISLLLLLFILLFLYLCSYVWVICALHSIFSGILKQQQQRQLELEQNIACSEKCFYQRIFFNKMNVFSFGFTASSFAIEIGKSLYLSNLDVILWWNIVTKRKKRVNGEQSERFICFDQYCFYCKKL